MHTFFHGYFFTLSYIFIINCSHIKSFSNGVKNKVFNPVYRFLNKADS